MSNLADISVDEWNKVAEFYCQTRAYLETRMVKYDSEHPDELAIFSYPFNFHRFQAEQIRKRPGRVHALCGNLQWQSDHDGFRKVDLMFEWKPEQLLWESPVGDAKSDTKLQILCGNVVSYSRDVADVFKQTPVPKYFQWNRPDQPKDEVDRKWLIV
jgi:hypothetical protein